MRRSFDRARRVEPSASLRQWTRLPARGGLWGRVGHDRKAGRNVLGGLTVRRWKRRLRGCRSRSGAALARASAVESSALGPQVEVDPQRLFKPCSSAGRHDTSCCAGPHSRSGGSRRCWIGGETNSFQNGRGHGSSPRRRWKMWMIASWTGRTTVAIRVRTVVRSLRRGLTGRISGADGVPSLVVTAIRAS
jgi:hypothetical protein